MCLCGNVCVCVSAVPGSTQGFRLAGAELSRLDLGAGTLSNRISRRNCTNGPIFVEVWPFFFLQLMLLFKIGAREIVQANLCNYVPGFLCCVPLVPVRMRPDVATPTPETFLVHTRRSPFAPPTFGRARAPRPNIPGYTRTWGGVRDPVPPRRSLRTA